MAWQKSVLSKTYDESFIPEIFSKAETLHFTILMLPLESEEQLELCRQALQSVQDQVQTMIKERGQDGALTLNYGELSIFGTPQKTRVVYQKLQEEGSQWDLFVDICDLLIKTMLDKHILWEDELSYISKDPETSKQRPN